MQQLSAIYVRDVYFWTILYTVASECMNGGTLYEANKCPVKSECSWCCGLLWPSANVGRYNVLIGSSFASSLS